MNELLDLRAGYWNLIVLPTRSHASVLIAAAQLAMRFDLTVLDCGRHFDSSVVARAARGRREIVDRIHVQRAFICSEAAKLLEQTSAGKDPVLVLDLLATFYDENVRSQMRKFLLERSLQHLQRLSRTAGVAVTACTPPNDPDSTALFQRLRNSASQVLEYEAPAAEARQLRLM